MEPHFVHPIVDSLVQLIIALLLFVATIAAVLLPWTPLIAWLAFWMFAVNWTKLREVLISGGWTGFVLIGVFAILVWGSIAPPPTGVYELFGLTLSNFVGKTVFVTGLMCLALLAGSLQLSGFCASCCRFEEPAAEDDHAHDAHGGHGHDSHDGGHAVAHAHH